MSNILNFNPLKNSISISYIKDFSDFYSSNKAINRTILLNKVKTIQNSSYAFKGTKNIQIALDFFNKNIKNLTLVPIYDSIIYREPDIGTNDLFELDYPTFDTDDYLMYGTDFADLQAVKITRINNFFIRTEFPIDNNYTILIPAKIMSMTNSFNINKVSSHYYIFNCQFMQLS